MRHLDAAAVADHALVLHAAVLAAGAFPVLFRAEDALAEQTVLFRAVGAVVDRLGLLDLAERPGADIVRAGQADAHRAVVVDAIVVDVAGAHGLALPLEGVTTSHTNHTNERSRGGRASAAEGLASPWSRRLDSPCLALLLSVSLTRGAQLRFFSSCMFSARPRISLVSTSKLAGVPASSVFSPLTIDS